jgi:uncharacterized membrane protein YkgB
MANLMTYSVEETTADAAEVHGIRKIYAKAASFDRFGLGLVRLGLVVVLVWIGGLKFARYEADGIVPLVANSPLMSFFYHHPPIQTSTTTRPNRSSPSPIRSSEAAFA